MSLYETYIFIIWFNFHCCHLYCILPLLSCSPPAFCSSSPLSNAIHMILYFSYWSSVSFSFSSSIYLTVFVSVLIAPFLQFALSIPDPCFSSCLSVVLNNLFLIFHSFSISAYLNDSLYVYISNLLSLPFPQCLSHPFFSLLFCSDIGIIMIMLLWFPFFDDNIMSPIVYCTHICYISSYAILL